MTGEGKRRRLLRLRGWGREGGILGRRVDGRAVDGRKRVGARAAARAATANRIEAMRRAAALYLASRQCVARDVAFILLPRGGGAEDEDPGGVGAARGAGDLMVFTRQDCFLVGFAPAKGRPGPALIRMAGRVRDLGRHCRIIHAETPAHAVEQLAKLIDGEAP